MRVEEFQWLFFEGEGVVVISTLFNQFHEALLAQLINVTQINHVFGHDTVLPDIPGALYTLYLYITHVRV